MYELHVALHGKARIWIDELPELRIKKNINISKELIAEHSLIQGRSCVAIELLLPRGPMCSYGLLGAVFSPDNSNQLTTTVLVSQDIGEPISWSLVDRIDTVYSGLPAEYSNSVLECAEIAQQTLGAGTLSFECAAHGIIGSSQSVFRMLAAAVVKVLEMHTPTQEELLELIEADFFPSYWKKKHQL